LEARARICWKRSDFINGGFSGRKSPSMPPVMRVISIQH
jgi:hypothetical protein